MLGSLGLGGGPDLLSPTKAQPTGDRLSRSAGNKRVRPGSRMKGLRKQELGDRKSSNPRQCIHSCIFGFELATD